MDELHDGKIEAAVLELLQDIAGLEDDFVRYIESCEIHRRLPTRELARGEAIWRLESKLPGDPSAVEILALIDQDAEEAIDPIGAGIALTVPDLLSQVLVRGCLERSLTSMS